MVTILQDCVRVDLVFPRSGQVLHIYVPDSHLETVSNRNYQTLLSLLGKSALKSYMEHLRFVHRLPA